MVSFGVLVLFIFLAPHVRSFHRWPARECQAMSGGHPAWVCKNIQECPSAKFLGDKLPLARQLCGKKDTAVCCPPNDVFYSPGNRMIDSNITPSRPPTYQSESPPPPSTGNPQLAVIGRECQISLEGRPVWVCKNMQECASVTLLGEKLPLARQLCGNKDGVVCCPPDELAKSPSPKNTETTASSKSSTSQQVRPQGIVFTEKPTVIGLECALSGHSGWTCRDIQDCPGAKLLDERLSVASQVCGDQGTAVCCPPDELASSPSPRVTETSSASSKPSTSQPVKPQGIVFTEKPTVIGLECQVALSGHSGWTCRDVQDCPGAKLLDERLSVASQVCGDQGTVCCPPGGGLSSPGEKMTGTRFASKKPASSSSEESNEFDETIVQEIRLQKMTDKPEEVSTRGPLKKLTRKPEEVSTTGPSQKLTRKLEEVPTGRPTSTLPALDEISAKVAAKCQEYRQLGWINRIKGGAPTKPREFSSMAGLFYNFGHQTRFACGGSLISDKFVLTAAHCQTHPKYGLVRKVTLGAWDLRAPRLLKPIQIYNVVERIPYPEYVPSQRSGLHDIMLLKLDRSVNFTEHIMPICLQARRDIPFKTGTTVGFGEYEDGELSSVLRKVELPFVPTDECNRAYKKRSLIDDSSSGIQDETQLCAGGQKGKDTCRGDSGGPLAVQLEDGSLLQVAITASGTAKCGTDGLPGVYTRISPYINWIVRTVWP